MIALALLFAGGLAVAVVGPRVVEVLLRRDVEPQLALRIWLVMTTASVVVTMVSLTLSVVPGHGGVAALIDLAHQCWSALHDTVPAYWETPIGAVAALTLLLGAIRGFIHFRRACHAAAAVHDSHLSLQRVLGPTTYGSVLRLPVDTPVAYSTCGEPGLVVIGQGLADRLDPQAVDAVLAHEAAHIDRRHHRIVHIADALAYAFPWMPITRRAPALARVLVELDADARAADIHGPAAVARALTELCGVAVPPASALAMANNDLELRITRLRTRRLATNANGGARKLRAAGATVLAAAAPVIPLVAAGLTLLLTSCVS